MAQDPGEIGESKVPKIPHPDSERLSSLGVQRFL
jgi:hypothetical protein